MDCKLRFYSRKQKNNKFGMGHFIMAEHKTQQIYVYKTHGAGLHGGDAIFLRLP